MSVDASENSYLTSTVRAMSWVNTLGVIPLDLQSAKTGQNTSSEGNFFGGQEKRRLRILEKQWAYANKFNVIYPRINRLLAKGVF